MTSTDFILETEIQRVQKNNRIVKGAWNEDSMPFIRKEEENDLRRSEGLYRRG